ncbi:uncharacterized protein LOC143912606 [Arctopsyche grandis]|uniref:uncharacterized protein LOC143912606 n=1 Tax=Arctopsyche grandis TaxID=121162 RepID=UPI00406D9156
MQHAVSGCIGAAKRYWYSNVQKAITAPPLTTRQQPLYNAKLSSENTLAVFRSEKATQAVKMKFSFAILCIVGLAAASHDDGSWKGEGLAESQDYGQYDGHYGVAGAHGIYAAGYAGHGGYAGLGGYAGHYAGPAAPLAHDGRVVDTPEVAHAKAAHFAAFNAAAHGAAAHGGLAHGIVAGPAYGIIGAHAAYAGQGAYAGHGVHYAGPAAPLGHDGRVVDTPEVAHAKAAHSAAFHAAAAGSAHGHGYGHH